MIWLLSALVVIAAWTFFREWALPQPPLGTVNITDLTITLGFVVAIPYLYLWLPGWLLVALLALSAWSTLWVIAVPVLASSVVRWLATAGIVAADLLLVWHGGADSLAFIVVNDLVILLMVVAVSNLWAQAGLRARDMAILAAALTFYDLVFTAVMPLTTSMIERLAGMPFLPMMVWPAGGDTWAGIGMGDLLMASVGPLVLGKAYGPAAGRIGVAVALVTIGAVLAGTQISGFAGTFPTMLALGPCLIVQVLAWSRRIGPARTYAAFRSDLRPARFPSDGNSGNDEAPSISGIAPVS
jgi:hypothetical protein